MFVRITSFQCIIFVLFSAYASKCHAFDIDKDLVFRLYTREDPIMYYSLKTKGTPSISETPFHPNRPTRIFIHGYKSKAKVLNRYTEAYLQLGDYNFIAVDWIEGASTLNYYSAKGRVGPISAKLAELIDALVAHGMSLHDLTVVGHSLGAHIAGRAGKQLKSPGKIACIVGLDPAGVGFDFYEREKRLTDSDAEYVQIIHTDGDRLGLANPIGHVDFYPNGGLKQPGCSDHIQITHLVDSLKCSHTRAHALYLESLTTQFPSIQCVSFEEIEKGQCTINNVTAIMGGDITSKTTKSYGIFYLETKLAPPYIIPDHRNFNKIHLVAY